MYRRKRRTPSQSQNMDPTLQPHPPVYLTMPPVYDELIDLERKNDAYDHPEGAPSRPASNVYQDLNAAAAEEPVPDLDQGTYIHPKSARDSDAYIHPNMAPASDAFKQYEGPEQPLVTYI